MFLCKSYFIFLAYKGQNISYINIYMKLIYILLLYLFEIGSHEVQVGF